MRVGDLFEWLAAIAISYGFYLVFGRVGAVFSAGVCLIYFAQCHAKTRFPKVSLPTIKLPQFHKRAVKS